MNRRNFVVGLGTVATISGVASVTAASFNEQVSPTTNFQIVPETAELVVRRLGNYDSVSTNDYFANESIDFANETTNVSTDVVAYVNESENGQLGAELTLNNTNETTFDQYHAPNASSVNGAYSSDSGGFFEIANLGDTDETIAITLNYNTDVVGNGNVTENQVANLFQFHDNDGIIISPDPDGSSGSIANNSTDPANEVTITSGEVETIGLAINLDQDIKSSIQAEAGTNPFEDNKSTVKLLDSIVVGTDYDPNAS